MGPAEIDIVARAKKLIPRRTLSLDIKIPAVIDIPSICLVEFP